VLYSTAMKPNRKTCKVCGAKWTPKTRYQAERNRTCSRACAAMLISKNRTGKTLPLALRKGQTTTCPVCGKQTWKPAAWLKRTKMSFCSASCRAKRVNAPILTAHRFDRTGMKFPGTGMAGANNPAWKGGVTYWRKHGNYKPIKYVRCPTEFMPMARKDGYIMEHRLIMARMAGRCLARTEVVHHRNHDPHDNRPENLELFQSNQAHKLAEGERARNAVA